MEKQKNSTITMSVVVDDKEQRIEVDKDMYWGIFSGHRPEDMSKEVFKQLSKQIQSNIDLYKKGKIKHVSKMTPSAWKEFLDKHDIKKNLKQKGVSYVKDTRQEEEK